MNKYLINLIIVASICLVSCDVIDAPYEETPDNPDTTGTVLQNVLLEDFTGHYCGNCPEATTIVRQLEAAYGDRLIVIALHVGNLALPNPPEYPMDFRTSEGTAIDKAFKNSLSGIPNGFVNRIDNGSGILLQKDAWSSVISTELARKPSVDLKVSRTYDSTTKTVTLDVTVKYLEAGTIDDNIVAMLTESKIISDQLDYKATPQHIEEYEFENVLRASLNGPWGEPLATTPIIAAGTTITKQFVYTLPNGKTWVPDNCDVVVYVHNYNASKRVLQVQKVSLTGK